MMKRYAIALLLAIAGLCTNAQKATISLDGMWRFQLDPMDFGTTPGSELYLRRLTDNVILPGSTDTNGKGIANTATHVDRLSRKFEYCGPAWYQREVTIPDEWAGKHIELSLERCHWETTVYIDGKQVGSGESLSTPNRFDLTEYLSPGTHVMTLRVDNRQKYPMDQWTHGLTEHTQTNWNGITGHMLLTARSQEHITNLQVYPHLEDGKIEVRTEVSEARGLEGTLSMAVIDREGNTLSRKSVPVNITDSIGHITSMLDADRRMKSWSEFHPEVYRLQAVLATVDGTDTLTVPFGMRTVKQGKHHIKINGRDVHLRGTLECAVFPLTGYPSTVRADWDRIFATVREYGMNHVRFHSWCPPEAAFEAADSAGIYLQVELPMWIKDVGSNPARRDFFEREMYAILDEYGNHPSFILFCNGNENEGDFAVLEDLVTKGRDYDDRHLYSASTARTHVKADQYFTSHVTTKSPSWITVYDGTPATDWDRSQASDIDVPVIAHETGQRCMYPHFAEMSKYSGVLLPRNFEVFRESLTRNGMLHQADDFFRATGAHTVLQYKEVNEALLRTANSGGFQLLGLTDFPGQGSAFVGILDPFWDSKGLVTPEEYRRSCAPTVLLARLPQRIFSQSDTISAIMEIYHFGEKPIERGTLTWSLDDETGHSVARGRLSHGAIPCDTVLTLGTIAIHHPKFTSPGKYTLRASAGDVLNEWDIWLYPDDSGHEFRLPEVCTREWDEARRRLDRGENVLYIPDDCRGRDTKFTGHFWNPIMFRWDPLIIGTLIDKRNGAFAQFPTDDFADWQWWDILNHAKAVDLTGFDSITPVIQSIDTYEDNRRLGIAFEGRWSNGKLFVLCVDPEKEIDSRPATRRLIKSISDYVSSEGFDPQQRIDGVEHALATTRQSDTRASSKAMEQLLNR